jgi:uncharacterized repeat protein (TIGR03803 family)
MKMSIKTSMKKLFVLPVLVGCLGFLPVGRTIAQTFTVLHSFTTTGMTSSNTFTNGDGAMPSRLILSGNTLYGTTMYGGSSGNGTTFKVNTDGTGFSILYNGGTGASASASDGCILSGNTLYGVAGGVGGLGSGTVYAVNTNGTGLTILHSFTAASGPYGTNSDGLMPNVLIVTSNIVYGTAGYGGSSGNGTVFSLTLPPPQMSIIPSQSDVILAWPTNANGYTLQSTTNLAPTAVWTTNSSPPVIVNGQYAVTNPISGKQKYFRLSQ